MTIAGMDVKGLYRDCSTEIDAPVENNLLGKHFFPDYRVCWRQRRATFLSRSRSIVADIEFIEPLKRIRSLHVFDSKYILRSCRETSNLVELLTPENSPEAVRHEMELATNLVEQMQELRQGGMPNSALLQMWSDYSKEAFPTNVIVQTNAPSVKH